ncbi:MAG TPA: hypothetical protein VFW46_01810 [Stellaceae bacterium]|nr:hypothetical protein [Stellaceae bacterium]
MLRSTQLVSAIAVVAAFALSPMAASAQTQSPAGVKAGPQSGRTIQGPAQPWLPASGSGWYTDGGGSGSSFPYHPGFHPVPAPPPPPIPY